jgi:hypothetical protein
VHTLVFVGDVEETAVIGDRDALHAWRAWELANELGCEGPRVYVGWGVQRKWVATVFRPPG